MVLEIIFHINTEVYFVNWYLSILFLDTIKYILIFIYIIDTNQVHIRAPFLKGVEERGREENQTNKTMKNLKGK